MRALLFSHGCFGSPGNYGGAASKLQPRRSEMVFACSAVHAMVGKLQPRIASDGNGNSLVPDSDEQLIAVLAKLDECRSMLSALGNRETAHLVSVAALDLRMRLNRISDADLKLLCEEIIANAEDRAREATASGVPASRGLLRVVK
jgi:hypothetical protein